MRVNVKSSVDGLGVAASGRARATFTEVDGWDEWKIELDLAVVGGRVEVRGILGITPEDPGTALHLTTRKMAALPLQALADSAMKGMDFTEQPDLQRAIHRIREADVEATSDHRSGVSLKDIAVAYLSAYYDPNVTNVNKAVAQHVNLSVRMSTYRVNDARALGLIPPDLPPRRRRKTTPAQSADDK